MPTSKKQLQSNRQNAQKSTGPKSPEGKAASSMNAVTHGLYSKDLIIDSPHLKESEDEFNQLYHDLHEEFLPVGLMEKYLVEKIVIALWRGRRAARAEVGAINRKLRDMSFFSIGKNADPEEQERDNHDKINEFSLPRFETCSNIMRYERRLDLQINRTYSLLICLQDRRKAKMMEDLRSGTFDYVKTNPDPDNEMEDNTIQQIAKNPD